MQNINGSDNSVFFEEQFGFTAVETLLMLTLMNGSSLSDYCELRSITINTAKTQLKSVFLKTGTHRQGELVALAHRLTQENARD